MKLRLTLRRGNARPKKRHRTVPLKLVYFLAISLLSAATGGAIYGIYRMVNQTLTVSEEVLRLRQEVSDEAVKADEFLKAVELLEVKQRHVEPPDWSKIPNPFQSNRLPQSPTQVPPPPPGLP